MTSSYSELRYKARQSLKGKWGMGVGGMLLIALAEFVLGLINMIPILGYIVSLLVGGALALGMYTFYLEIARNENTSATRVFSGFEQFVRALILYILMAVFIFLWTLLLIIPGIIAGYRYSQAYYILKDNPDISPLDAINRSKELMVGKKGRLFVLHLTFIGWAILASLTFGIGYLWLAPYFLVTQAHFYDEINGRNEEPPVPIEYQFSSYNQSTLNP